MKSLSVTMKRLLQGLVITLGCLTSLTYLTTSLIAANPERIEAYLQSTLGLPVRIASAQAHWHPLTPGLRLYSVRLGERAETTVLREARIGLNFASLLSPDRFQVTLIGVKLHIIRQANRALQVRGWPSIETGAKAPDSKTEVRPQRIGLPAKIRLAEAEFIWEDHFHQRPPLRIAPAFVETRSGSQGLELNGYADSVHGRLEFATRFDGHLAQHTWSGRTRLIARQLDLAALLRDYLPEHYRLSAAVLDADIDINWRSGNPSRIQGRIDLADVGLGGDATVQLQRLGADILFSRPDIEAAAGSSDDWQLNLDAISVSRDGRAWPVSALELEYRDVAPNGPLISVAADFLRLQDLAAILAVRAPWAPLQHALEVHQPHGDVRDLQLLLDLSQADPKWRAAARLLAVGWQHHARVPGITGLSGHLSATTEQAQFDLDSSDLSLDFGNLFRAPLQVDKGYGRLNWQRGPDITGDTSDASLVWQLRSPNLHLRNEDLELRTQLRLAAYPEQPLFIDLRSTFDGKGVSNAGRYYPTRIMRPSLVRWLDRSIVSGQITRGSLSLFGPLEDFPFVKKRNGHFEILFDVDNMVLDYREQWPPLTDMTAEVRFHGLELDIALQQAKIYDSEVSATHGRFDRLHPTSPLQIRGVIDGPLSDELRLLRESPLRERLGVFAEAAHASGPAHLELDLDIPMRKDQNYRLDGRLQFLESGLALHDWDLPLRDIRGELRFDTDSVSGEAIQANGLSTELSVDVVTLDQGTRISARGELDMPTIRSQAPKLPLHLARGSSLFDIDVTIPNNSGKTSGKPVLLDIGSSLRGISIDAPAPLGKTAGQSRVLGVRIPISGRGGHFALSYDNQVKAVISRDLERAEVRIGGAPARLPEQTMYRLRGTIPEVDVAAWRAFGERQGNTFAPARRGKGVTGVSDDGVLDAAVRIERIRLGTTELENLGLKVTRAAGQLQGEVDSDLVKGRFSSAYPSYERLQLDLEHIRLKTAAEDTAAQPGQTPPDTLETLAALDPRDWPALDLRSKQLQINDANLGRLELVATKGENGLDIDRLFIDGELGSVNAQGDWRHTATGIASGLEGGLQTPRLGELLEQLGFTRQFDDAVASAKFDLRWPGDPRDIVQRNYTGTLDLALEQGRLLDIDPGAGRVIGLLNFGALQRRLRLDFSDLFKKGLSFDDISGHFTLQQGDAHTKDLTIDGPAGKIELSGRTGLTRHDVDQLIRVTPKMNATLPVASAIAGGPAAGLAVLLAQQLLSDKVDQLNYVQYSLKGPWSDPLMTLESSGAVAKLLTRGDDKLGDRAPPPSAKPAPAPAEQKGTAKADPQEAASATKDQGLSLGRLHTRLGAEGTGLEDLETNN